MPTTATLSITDARRLAVAAQGLSKRRRTGAVGRSHLLALASTLGVIQLDAVNVLERTQFVVPFSRLGPYDAGLLHTVSGPQGALFEFWGHAASLMPTEMQPLFRWRMAYHAADDGTAYAERRREFRKENARYIASLLDEIRDRGALAASQLTDPRRRDGEWWDRRSLGRVALEQLFATGELAGWRAPNFERIYDLPERVLPRAVLEQPTPAHDDAVRALVLQALRAHGVATVADCASYFGLKVRNTQTALRELAEAGAAVPVAVEGWRDAAYTTPNARPAAPRRSTATLLTPFDSLIWDRSRTERLFDFAYRIEIYTPAPKRTYGYYVLPMLLGERLVGRFDLKADRAASQLLVRGAFLEAGVDAALVVEPARAELAALASWLGLDGLSFGKRGNLMPALRTGRPPRRTTR